jgi:hypothetical protein
MQRRLSRSLQVFFKRLDLPVFDPNIISVISIQRDSTRAAAGRRFGCSGIDLIAGAADPIPAGTCRGIHATFRMIVAEALNISANDHF